MAPPLNQLATASPELWRFYGCLVEKLEGERAFILAQVENLRISVEETHRAEWERKTRLLEIEDLQVQLKDAERRLVERQEALLNASMERNSLRARAPRWEADLEHLQAVARPRLEALRYCSGAPPEKVCAFLPCNCTTGDAGNSASTALGCKTRAGAKERAPEPVWPIQPPLWPLDIHSTSQSSPSQVRAASPGPVLVEYLAQDRDSLARRHLHNLQEQLLAEQEGRKEGQRALEDLWHTEEEEHALLLQVLQEQLRHVRSRRELLHSQADKVTRLHILLSTEHEHLKQRSTAEVMELQACSVALSLQLQDVTAHHCAEVERAVVRGQSWQEQACGALTIGFSRVREDSAFFQRQLEVVKEQGTSRIRALDEQLEALRRRYHDLVGFRSQELCGLRSDVLALQQAVRKCEQLAARCVATAENPDHDRDAAAAALDGLALRPAVERLCRVLARCEGKLREEEGHGQGPGSGSGSRSILGGGQSNTSTT